MVIIEDLEYIYHKRWGIETNYNTLKNRFYIENYSSKKRRGIEKDVYSKFFIFNIFHYLKLVFNMLIKMKNTSKELKKNSVNQAGLIRNINNHLPFMILSPFEEICKTNGKLFYNSCRFANQSN